MEGSGGRGRELGGGKEGGEGVISFKLTLRC
jgi:hypothetical protein